MTTKPIELDKHRGMISQRDTELRRLRLAVEADQASLKARQDELEAQLLLAPAKTWPEAAEKAQYLIGLLAATTQARDPRRKKLITGVLEDFERLREADKPV